MAGPERPLCVKRMSPVIPAFGCFGSGMVIFTLLSDTPEIFAVHCSLVTSGTSPGEVGVKVCPACVASWYPEEEPPRDGKLFPPVASKTFLALIIWLS